MGGSSYCQLGVGREQVALLGRLSKFSTGASWGHVAASTAVVPTCLERLVTSTSGVSVAPSGQVGLGKRLVNSWRSLFHPWCRSSVGRVLA